MVGGKKKAVIGEFRGLVSFLLVILICLLPCVARSDDGTTGGDDSGGSASGSSVARVAVGGDTSDSSGGDTALPDLFTGAMSYRIPIEVPPGRNGMQPGLALAYRSSNVNGWVGMGWEMEVGAIERSTRTGVDYTKDNFVLRRAGSLSELVSSNGHFQAKIESDFLQIYRQPDGSFLAIDKQGIKFFFGSTPDSKISGAGAFAGSPGTFRWSLSSIVDPFGNTITFSYAKYPDYNANGVPTDTGQIYLDHINYNGNQILFYTESRDDAPNMYTTNFLVKTGRRLKAIDVLGADGSRVRTYALNYGCSSSTGRSMLISVQKTGKDVSAAQEISFTYTQANSSFQEPSSSPWLNNNVSGSQTYNLGYQFSGDFNGDGKMDFMYLGSDGWHVALSNGSGFETPTRWLSNSEPNAQPYTSNGSSGYQYVGDFNGDGKIDLMYAGVNGGWYVAMSNGSDKFETPIGPSAPIFYVPNKFVGDFNGDGKMDFMYYYCSYNSTGWCVTKSNGNGFDTPTRWLSNSAPNDPSYYGIGYQFVGDFNGDGKADLLYLGANGWYVAKSNADGSGFDSATFWLGNSGPGGYTYNPKNQFTGDFNGDGKMDFMYLGSDGWYVALSNGNGFETPTRWLENNVSGSQTHNAGYQFVGDFNGDGKMDFMYLGSDGWYVAKSNGISFEQQPTRWLDKTGPSGQTYNAGYQFLGDFNGDGKLDFMYNYNGWYVALNDKAADLLSTVSNSYGGVTTVEYMPSTAFNNPLLPFAVQVVSSLTTDDGTGNRSTIGFSYDGGYYYIPEHDFRGFNHVTVTGPAGAGNEQKITETWFHQGNDLGVDINNRNASIGYMKGKPYRVRVKDGSGNVFSETETVYAASRQGDSFYFNPPAQVHTYICDGKVTGRCDETTAYAKHYRTDYFFDYNASTEYGNLSYEYRYGDVDNPNDDLTIHRSYFPNESAGITGFPASETVYQGLGASTQVASTSFYYDGATDCETASTNQSPTKGKLTRTEHWQHYGDTPDTLTEERAAYDSYGNLICRSDANHNTTTIGYDPSNTFPIVATNSLGQQTFTSYYGVNNVPTDKGLYGQTRSVTDANSAATVTEYDSLGRKIKETLPDNTWTTWSYNNFGSANSQNIRTVTSAGSWSEDYFDGLQRSYRKKASGPEAKVIAVDTHYDDRGAVAQTSLPYLDGGESVRFKTYGYDPLGRVVRASAPLSATETINSQSCYDHTVTVIIDPNGHRRREVRDSNNRLVTVQEYTGHFDSCTTEPGDPYATTTYQYDVLGNLRFVTDAKGNQTEIRYDTLGRKRYMSDPDMGVWTYAYDTNGNLKTQTDAKGQTITFTYDSLNRLTTKHFPSGPDIVFTYDEPTSTNGKGRLTGMTDATCQTVYNYDTVGRIGSTGKTIDGATYRMSYTYPNGLLKTITYPDNETVSYSYDAGYLKSVDGYVIFSNFDALGRPGNEAYGSGGASTSYTYDSINKRLTELTVLSPTQGVLVDNVYGYDTKGNITSIDDRVNTSLPMSLSSDTYTPVRAHAVGSTGSGRIFGYDDNGNITSDGTRTITYNYDNMPTAIGTVGFTYDGASTRVKKTIPGVFTTIYPDKLYECTNGLCSKFIFAGNRRIAIKTDTVVLYYHPDHQGSTSVVTNALGGKEEGIAYYPFGGTRQDTGAVINLNHKYTGQEQDQETGLYNYNARIYDPELGRFLTPDSIVQAPDDPQALNRYAYGRNNPINNTDPTGHFFGVGFLVSALITAEVIKDVAIGVTIGAALGATTSAIQGGDVLQGMAIGAGSGAVFGGVSGFVGATSGDVMGGLVAGGMAAGAAGSAMSGANVGEGIYVGGLGGAAFGSIRSYWGNRWDVWRVGATTLAGGGLSAAAGGDFTTGALFAFGASTAAYAYNSAVRYGADWNSGGDAVEKNRFDYPVEGKNNIGTQGGPVDPNGWFNEGGRVSRFANFIPGVNAVSGMHDMFQVTLDKWGGDWARNILNVPGMIPAAGITYGALMTDMRAAALYNTMSTRGRTR